MLRTARPLILAVTGAAVLPAAAAAQVAAPAPPVSEVVVTADPAGLLERRAGAAVLGLAKPLYETPRAASLATAETLDRYGVRTIDDLTAVEAWLDARDGPLVVDAKITPDFCAEWLEEAFK